MSKPCERCGKQFKPRWRFGRDEEYTIDNKICPSCYRDWLPFVDETGKYKAGNTKFWILFLASYREKVQFT